MDHHEEQWQKIIEIQSNLKQIIIYAEEFEENNDTFLQPSLEQKHALDHIVRAQSAILGLKAPPDTAAYINLHFDKAIGHLYRAFFDAADWLSIIIRRRIRKLLAGYSNQCIMSAMPAYYSDLKPAILSACKEIADIRGAKDIGKSNSDMIDEVNKYYGVLNVLKESYEEIVKKIPSLDEYNKKQRSSRTKSVLINIALVLISVAATAAVSYWMQTPAK